MLDPADFSFRSEEFGYRTGDAVSQLSYFGLGAGVLVEWHQCDGVMVWLLPLSPGEVPVDGVVWVGRGVRPGPRRGDRRQPPGDRGLRAAGGPADDANIALPDRLRPSGQDMLRGNYS